MVQVVIDVSKYILLIILILYGINCFRAMHRFGEHEKKSSHTAICAALITGAVPVGRY